MQFEKFLNSQTGHLDLHSCQLTDKDMPTLCDFVNTHPEVKSLNLHADHTTESNHITEAGCAILAKQLADNPTLVALHLGGNKIGNEGVKFLSQLTQLTLLDLKDTGINEHGIYSLNSLNKLISLDVSFNDLGEFGIYSIVENHPSLRILSVQHCKLHNTHLAAISEMPNLIVLNISNNNLSDASAKHILQMKKLCFIDLTKNKFSEQGIHKLAQMQFAQMDTKIEKELISATSERISYLTKEKSPQGLWSTPKSVNQTVEKPTSTPASKPKKP